MPILGIVASSRPTASTAFDSIATATGTGSSGTITFSSIPSTYQHLQIRGIIRGTSVTTGRDLNLRFNSDSASNYKSHYLIGTGASTLAGEDGGGATTSIWLGRAYANGALASTTSAVIIDVHDYGSTTKNKTVRSFQGRDDNGTAEQSLTLASGLWLSTSAISSISLLVDSGNFGTSSTFALYGIKGA